MATHSGVRRILLAPRDVFVLDAPEPLEIELHSGCLWLTQAGDPNDVVLCSGQSFAVPRGAQIVVSSRRAAEFVVTAANCSVGTPRPARHRWRRVADLVHRAREAGGRLASRLHLGPPAQPGLD